MTFISASWHPGTPGPTPTVVALHGHGAHGMDLLGLAPYLAGGRVLMLCPQAEFEIGPGSYTWFNRPPDGQRSVDEVERVTAALRTFIDKAVPRAGGDPSRMVVLGFSQGGTLAYRLGLGEPRRFAGIAALSTYFPDDLTAAIDRDHIADVPLLIQHGTEDPQIEVARARTSRDLLMTLGARPEYHEYPMRHEIAGPSLGDLGAWLTRVLKLDD